MVYAMVYREPQVLGKHAERALSSSQLLQTGKGKKNSVKNVDTFFPRKDVLYESLRDKLYSKSCNIAKRRGCQMYSYNKIKLN